MRELLDTENRTTPCHVCSRLEIVHGFGPACSVCGSQMTECDPRPGDSYIKHVGSWLSDLPVRVAYDDETRTVTLTADEFDSFLISELVIHRIAPAGIIAFTDEIGEIQSPRAPWNLVFMLAGVPYRLHVVRQPVWRSGGQTRVVTRLIPFRG